MVFKTFALLTLAAGLAAAQTDTVYTLDAHGSCTDPNSSACWVIYKGTTPMDFSASEAPWLDVQATFTTGLNIPASFHTGSLHPQIPTPQFGAGQGTFNWSDGLGHTGTVTVSLDCRFDVYGAWPFYATTCNGTDAAGNNVSFTHILYVVGPRRFGYWGWADDHGTMTLSLVN